MTASMQFVLLNLPVGRSLVLFVIDLLGKSELYYRGETQGLEFCMERKNTDGPDIIICVIHLVFYLI